MSDNRLNLIGLDGLIDALQRMPIELRDQAREIVETRARLAHDEIKAAYPARVGGGNLTKGLYMEVSTSAFGVGARIINRSYLARIFELGTVARHNALGAYRGAMPAGKVFVPRIMRHRRLMYVELARLLEYNGLHVVSG